MRSSKAGAPAAAPARAATYAATPLVAKMHAVAGYPISGSVAFNRAEYVQQLELPISTDLKHHQLPLCQTGLEKRLQRLSNSGACR